MISEVSGGLGYIYKLKHIVFNIISKWLVVRPHLTNHLHSSMSLNIFQSHAYKTLRAFVQIKNVDISKAFFMFFRPLFLPLFFRGDTGEFL